ncbi:MAG: TGS domain-containing protein [Candidatus Jordarchaeales archaeon]
MEVKDRVKAVLFDLDETLLKLPVNYEELREKLKYAVVWGSGKFSGQRVGRQHVLEDGDVVELLA